MSKQKKVLVTGGAGFIGQKLSQSLISDGIQVRILDNFSPQIHSSTELSPEIADQVELIIADVRDRDEMKLALNGVDAVVHLAAETGTG
ncbi:MAG: SDR family NAD(P)-dependent oxidoreductase, partial [Methylophilus sp.]